MKKENLEIYTDYLICNSGFATATGLSAMIDGDISHDQMTRFLSAREYTSKDLWGQVKATVRQIEQENGCLIFDDTIQEKAWTDENEIMCWHFDHCKGRSVRGINLLNALYYSSEVSIPVAFEVVLKPNQFSDVKTRKVKRASEVTKNELMRNMVAVSVANAIKFRYVLTDSWFASKENFEFILNKDKHFISALKDNRMVAFFVYDRQTGKNENVAAQYRYATDLAISTDGRFISFVKRLEDGSHHLSNAGEILIHDRVNNKTARVDVTANGTPGNDLSTQPNFSADGRYIAFSSGSSNLIAGDSNGFWDIFVYDSLTRKTERVSIAPNGNPTNGSSYRPSLSANGRYVTFASYADNLVAGDNNTVEDIFIHDRVTHKTERVDNSPKDLSELGYSFSADAHFIAFYSRRLMERQITRNDVYLYNRVAHRSVKMRVGALGSSQSSAPSLNADGRYMAFMSDATNLVARDTNRVADIFVHDRLLDTAHRADLKIIATQKPTNLKPNSQGNYFYTLINKGKDTATDISLLHMISGGSLVRVKPSQGNCYFSTVETVCHLGELNAGKKLTLLIGGKAQNGTFSQQVTVSSAPWDVEPINNHIAVSTPVR